MTLGVECAPETDGRRRVHVEFFESHDGVRCDCVSDGVMVLFEGDTISVTETITCEGCGTSPRSFALNVTIVQVEQPVGARPLNVNQPNDGYRTHQPSQ